MEGRRRRPRRLLKKTTRRIETWGRNRSFIGLTSWPEEGEALHLTWENSSSRLPTHIALFTTLWWLSKAPFGSAVVPWNRNEENVIVMQLQLGRKSCHVTITTPVGNRRIAFCSWCHYSLQEMNWPFHSCQTWDYYGDEDPHRGLPGYETM